MTLDELIYELKLLRNWGDYMGEAPAFIGKYQEVKGVSVNLEGEVVVW